MKVDIVGGSLAGLSTAISIKKHDKDIDVNVHEKYKEIGYNHEGRRCGEAHSIADMWKKWMPKGKSIFNEITLGVAYIGKKVHRFERKPKTAFILDRQEFIAQLGREAEKLGANIITNNKIKTINDLKCDYIVDASGCPSSIKRELKLDKGIKGVTYQQTLENSNCFEKNIIKVYYSGIGGYYWIFPRDQTKKEINLGLGYVFNPNINLKKDLEDFKEKHQIKGEVNYVVGGLIPIGIQRPILHKNIIFVGDACVGTFPFSGQGIYRALISGDIAGKCLAKNQVKRYKWIINHEFIKWDVIGKTFTYANRFFSKINPDIVLRNLDIFIKYGSGFIH